MELCLGTVQFGMEYGIRGVGRPKKEAVYRILSYAYENGIKSLDTASGYGEAQRIIGDYLVDSLQSFQIISKLPFELYKELQHQDYKEAIKRVVEQTLSDLRVPKLHGLLFHNPENLYDEYALESLQELKRMGIVDQIGVSVYDVKDANYAFEHNLDIIQIPNNLFDRRFDLFLEKVTPSQQVFARSVYLQGLLLMDVEEVKKKLPCAVGAIQKFDALCERYQCSRRECALAYIKGKKGIHSMIFGVDNLDQLTENICAYQRKIENNTLEKIAKEFEKISETIVSPLNWKRT